MDRHVKFVENGAEAMAWLTGPEGEVLAKNLVALFLDLKLPGMGGLEILERLREDPRYARLPFIVMTSSVHPQDEAICRERKVSHYVAKPVSAVSLAKAVADAFPRPMPELAPSLSPLKDQLNSP